MKRKALFLFGCLLCCSFVQAQVTKLQTKTSIDSLLPTNTSKTLTAARIREAFSKTLNFADVANISGINLSKLAQSGATANQVPLWNGASWVPTTIASLGGSNVIDVRTYGATGNGTSNDVAAIQAALNAGAISGKKVVGHKGDIYLVGSQGVKNFMTSSITGLSYCIDIPSGVTFDLQGGTLKSTADAVIISNRGSTTNTDVNITLCNGILDGGGALLNDKPFLFFYGVTGLKMTNIVVQNTTHLVSTFTNLTRAYFNNLTARNVVGNAWQFGLPTTNQQIYDSYIGDVFAYDILPESEPIYPGSAFLASIVRCRVNSIFARNVGSGVKVQQGSRDVNIGSVDLRTSNNSNFNSGFKVQGTDDSKVENIIVGQIKCTDQHGTGLYIEKTKNVRIGQYFGENNAPTGAYPDVWIAGDYTNISDITTINSGGTGVLIRADAQSYAIETANIIESGNAVTSSGIFLSSGSKGSVNSLIITDNQATKTINIGLNISASDVQGYCGNLTVNGLGNSAWLAFISATNYRFGNLRMTTSQRNDMVVPASGFTYYDVTTNSYVRYNGTVWVTY